MRKSLKSFFTCKREMKKNSMAEWSQKLFILLPFFCCFFLKGRFFFFFSFWKEEKKSSPCCRNCSVKGKKLWTINYSLLKLQKRNFYFVLKEIFLSALMILNRITKANFISLLFCLFFLLLFLFNNRYATWNGRGGKKSVISNI